jgi:HPt (histidine-containing phosphotransfer) domain-containing protein
MVFLKKFGEKMQIEIPGIDSQIVADLYNDDLEMYTTILHSFVNRIPEVLNKIRNVSSETLPDYKIKIHALKGSSGSVGAKETMAEAARLEVMAKNEDLAGILAGNDAFLERVDVLVDDIKSWLEQSDERS